MADDNTFDIGIGTKADLETLKKALADIEKKVKASATKQNKDIDEASKKSTQAFKDFSKDAQEAIDNLTETSGDSIKDFARDAAQSLSGIDFSKLFIPAAVAASAITALRKIISSLNDMAAAYRRQEQAEKALAFLTTPAE